MPKKDPKDTQQQLLAKIEELTIDLQRVHADFANFRRRNDEERAQLSEFAKIAVVTKLLPLIDNIERALGHLPPELADNQWAKGVAQLDKQFETALKDLGIEPIDALGKPFDPHWHEAVSYEEGGEGEEVVIEVLQRGYRAGDKVVRHSVTKVGKRQDKKHAE